MRNSFIGALALVPLVASGQGLFDIAPNDEATDSVSLNYTAGVRVGWDSNVTPGLAGDENDTGTVSAYIGANALKVSERSTSEVYARYSATYNLDAPESVDEINHNVTVGFNYTYRLSERLRFASRNHLSYGLEPDYNFGFANTRTVNEYLYWNTDQSIGYQFSDRVGAYFGVRSSGTIFDEGNDAADRITINPYMQWRYQLSPRSVLTAGYGYTFHLNDTNRDATSHTATVGLEHRISPTAVFTIRGGVQYHDVDGGDSTLSPYFEGGYRWNPNSRTSIRAFAYYGISNFNTQFGNDSFDVNQNFRLGVAGTHQLTERLSLNAGVDYIFNDYQDSPDGLADVDGSLVNVYFGANYKLSNNLYLDATVNHTQAISDLSTRDYDRTRLSAGLSYSW